MSERTFTLRFPGIIGAFMYIALGLAVYMWLGNYETFSWTAPLLYVYMALWPLMLLLEVMYLILIGVAAFVVVLVAIHIWDVYSRARTRKRLRQIRDVKKRIDALGIKKDGKR